MRSRSAAKGVAHLAIALAAYGCAALSGLDQLSDKDCADCASVPDATGGGQGQGTGAGEGTSESDAPAADDEPATLDGGTEDAPTFVGGEEDVTAPREGESADSGTNAADAQAPVDSGASHDTGSVPPRDAAVEAAPDAGSGGAPDAASDAPPCNSDSCPHGCCTASGGCAGGGLTSACGSGGAACANCASSGLVCSDQACVTATSVPDSGSSPTCTPSTCSNICVPYFVQCCKSNQTCGCALLFPPGSCN